MIEAEIEVSKCYSTAPALLQACLLKCSAEQGTERLFIVQPRKSQKKKKAGMTQLHRLVFEDFKI